METKLAVAGAEEVGVRGLLAQYRTESGPAVVGVTQGGSINPDFAGQRWPWPLNPLDARMSAAWFVGWAVWLGTMALERDWDRIRIGIGLLILWGFALMAINLVFLSEFDFSRPTPRTHLVAVPLLTLIIVYFYWQQERVRRREPAP